MDASALGAGWRVLQRHLRYAEGNPRKLLWIARRAWQIVSGGQLRGVLRRHRLIADIHEDYVAWVLADERGAAERITHYREQANQWQARPRFSVLMPIYASSLPFLEEAVESVMAQHYTDWELCIVDDASPTSAHIDWLSALAVREPRIRFLQRAENGGIAVATNAALAAATGDYCLFLDQDDRLAPTALFEFALRVVERPQAQMIYADEDRIDHTGGRSRPFFKPDWDPEWLRTTNYVLHPIALRTAFLRALGGVRTGLDGVQDWDLVLRAGERAAPGDIEHIPRILYHWREHAGSTAAGIYEKPGVISAQERALRDSIARRGETAEVASAAGVWRIRYTLPAQPPLASIVIPTRDHVDRLRRCIDGLRRRTAYARWEAIIVDNGSTDADTIRYIRSLAADPRLKVVRDERRFSYSALCNKAVSVSGAEIIVLLNDDVDPINANWLTELVTHARRPDIGLVSAVLYYQNDTIQHAGVIIGLNGVADRPYVGYPRGFRGVDNRLLSVHTVTAMITACAAVRRSVYQRVGGLDETLPIRRSDIDLCLRVADLGLRNVLTPHAELYCNESTSSGNYYEAAASVQARDEEAYFREKWRGRLDRDPAYNPNLTYSGTAYSLASA